jgi:hypothetical protein
MLENGYLDLSDAELSAIATRIAANLTGPFDQT